MTIHGLIGQNGAGKSTMIKILGGLYRADAGSIDIDGRALPHVTPRRHRRVCGVHIIHQEALLLPSFTVAEALFLGQGTGSSAPSSPPAACASEAEQIIAAQFRHRHCRGGALIGELSAAQRQIVQITRALLNRPSVLVFDEPTAALVRREANRLFAHHPPAEGRGHIASSISPIISKRCAISAIASQFCAMGVTWRRSIRGRRR